VTAGTSGSPLDPIAQILAHASVDLPAEEVALLASHATNEASRRSHGIKGGFRANEHCLEPARRTRDRRQRSKVIPKVPGSRSLSIDVAVAMTLSGGTLQRGSTSTSRLCGELRAPKEIAEAPPDRTEAHAHDCVRGGCPLPPRGGFAH
jgi:hypothetical protein